MRTGVVAAVLGAREVIVRRGGRRRVFPRRWIAIEVAMSVDMAI